MVVLSNQFIIWITIGLYAIMMLLIGVAGAKSSKGVSSFTVGGRNAGAWISALSYGTAYFSAVMFIGYAGTSGWKYGLWSVLVGIGNAVFGSWLAWKVLARRTRDISHRLKIKSMPELLARRYQSQGIRSFSAVVIFIFLLPYSASVYKGLTSICSVLLGIDDQICMLVIAIVSALIVILGGYLATLKADFVQGILMMFVLSILIVFVMMAPNVREGGGISGMWEYMKQNQMVPLRSSDAISLIATIVMTSFGTWGLPQMIHKYYGIKDDHEVKRGIVISTFFAFLVAGGGYFIGSLSHLFLDAVPEKGMDYIVPLMLKDSNLPNILLGLVLVLLISASVSTLSAITLTACSTVTLDLVKEKRKKGLSDENAGVMTRVFCLLFVVFSYIVANTNTPILDMMSYSWGILSGSFLAPYLLSLYWKKANRIGAWASILSGFVVAFIPGGAKLLLLAGISSEGLSVLAGYGPVFAVAAMILSLIVCIIVSLIADKYGRTQDNTYFYTGFVESE